MKPLEPGVLRRQCDEHQFAFETTAELKPLGQALGQERALAALEFATGIDREGYNLYAMGESGAGKFSIIHDALQQRAESDETPDDWCYINNFKDPQKPIALAMPAGHAQSLRNDMEQLVGTLRNAIPAAFDSDVYRSRMNEIDDEFNKRQEDAFAEIQEQAKARNMAILHTPAGFGIAPIKDGEVIGPQAFEKLTEAEQKQIEKVTDELKERLSEALLHAPDRLKHKQQQIEELNREIATTAIQGPIDELRARYDEFQPVLDYLDHVQADVLAHLVEFGDHSTPQTNPLGLPQAPSAFFKRYQINVIVEHEPGEAAPLIFLDNPSYGHLIGRIEHTAHMGTLITDFTQIKPGAIHRSNGGYLILEARKLLLEPYAWYALKRTLRAGCIDIESIGELLGLSSTGSLDLAPIPLRMKVILLGEPEIYYLLCAYDPEFNELFKVAAEFEDRIDRGTENTTAYAMLIASLIEKQSLLPFDRGSIAEVIDHAARIAEDADKMTLRMRKICDLLTEADHWARVDDAKAVAREHVTKAIEQQIDRLSRMRERLQEAMLRETLLIATQGDEVGQINGLSVLRTGDFSFGQPSRITATVRMGKGEVIDVQREAKLGGAIHSKGVMILSAYLGARYASQQPLSLSASLVFEQTYGLVDGDSASVAEICALLSALADIPIKQSLAVTGSVNQLGQVQAIGGVNEKIEAFFDLCESRGLSGNQGVLIPRANVKHLMLRQDIVDAAASGGFQIFAVDTIDQAVEKLTDCSAGEADKDGAYPEDSVNGRVASQLAKYTEQMRVFAARSETG